MLLLSCSKDKEQTSDDDDADGLYTGAHEKPLYKMTPREIDFYLNNLHKSEPVLEKRITTIAKKFIGQPHEQEIIGDFPIEGTQYKPMFAVEESDCSSFFDNTLAMALADSWRSYFIFLQRIRYKDGIISWETRNHFFEADWEISNSWLVKDISESLGKDLLKTHELIVDRDQLFNINGKKNPYPMQRVKFSYFPSEHVPKVLPLLKTGYIFNLIRSDYKGSMWIGHLGFIVVENGIVYMMHSGTPIVHMIPLMDYMEKQLKKNEEREKKLRPCFRGFRFLKIQENPMQKLEKIDGPMFPRLVIYGNK